MQLSIYAFREAPSFSYEDLLRVEADVFVSDYGVYDTEQWGMEKFALDLPEKNKYSFVARSNDRIVGFSIGYAFQPSWLHISRVAVMKEFRGKRIGYLLISTQLQGMKADAPKVISIDVTRKNTRAIRLYEESGFRTLAGQELRKYLNIRGRKQEEYLGEEATHAVMIIGNKEVWNHY
jgi:ribosomal protein S18 acetylase RimI-like enzyme